MADNYKIIQNVKHENSDILDKKYKADNNLTSLKTLIIWNVSKALETKPNIDVKYGIQAAKARLEHDARDVNAIMPKHPEERYLTCALLAWQQLGHSDADSLCQFIEENNIEGPECKAGFSKKSLSFFPSLANNSKVVNSGCFNCAIGPVVKLPVESKLIMRVNTSQKCCKQNERKRPKIPEKDILNKIEAACCIDTACVERLASIDMENKELTKRAATLASREAERMQLLDRAEAAWKDLELGYQRRLRLSQEREEDLRKQVERVIEERNSYKCVCNKAAEQLQIKKDAAEVDRERLSQLEKQVCQLACTRLKLSEESTRVDAALNEQQCKIAQFGRDLKLQEEQTRRKKLNVESELDSARSLTHEVERATRAELTALRDQLQDISSQLFHEDDQNKIINETLEDMKREKSEMLEDLEGCQAMCDERMKAKFDELNKKREQLAELKNKVLECRCKFPVDATVEVKRTPSLAAMCHCEKKKLESCSCTSIRGRLLSSLLSDLFSGLQAELGSPVTEMPCQLLKCLEDKHNWDRSSIIKTNLKNYFSQLLVGELDIAIANSIEKYHVKWISETCADRAKSPGPSERQQREIEKKAHKMATELAERMFTEKADELTQKAKEVMASGQLPCLCKPGNNTDTAVYPCLVKPGPAVVPSKSPNRPWKQTLQDVSQLRVQIEELKKGCIKKEDLKLMESKLTKIIQRAPRLESDHRNLGQSNLVQKKTREDLNNCCKRSNKLCFGNSIQYKGNEKSLKCPKKFGQTYAINTCICSHIDPNKTNTNHKDGLSEEIKTINGENLVSKDASFPTSVKQSKPINNSCITCNDAPVVPNTNKICPKETPCFHKAPSIISLNNLLETLNKWKIDLANVGVDNSQPEKEIPSKDISANNENNKDLNPMTNNNNEMNTDFNKEEISTKNKSLSIITTDKKIKTHSTINQEDNLKTESSLNSLNFISVLTDSTEFNKKQTNKEADIVKHESEYMGAVNLDRSNENGKGSLRNNESSLSDCNTTPVTYNLPMEMSITATGSSKEKVPITEHKNQLHTKVITGKEEELLVQCNNQLKNESETCLMNKVEADTIDEKSCDYEIKFLGVTLTDVNSDKDTKSCIDQSVANNNKKSKSNHNNLMELKGDENITQRSLQNWSREAKLTKKSEECYRIDSKLAKPNLCSTKVSHISRDKTLGVQILHDDKKIDNCVCCNNPKGNESKELEENAFRLLQEHLKHKLEDFKDVSTCIPPEEEEKLFATILQRVKYVISESANKVSCKCLVKEKGESNGSWNRAYSLLQEYLKLKIKRVQCSCVLAEDNKDSILPEVLDKVSNLIENDFKRLKEVCGCQENKENEGSSNIVAKKSFIKFKRKSSENDVIIGEDKSCQFKSITKESKTLQVPPNLGMDTKSCDALEIQPKKNQVTDSVKNPFHNNWRDSNKGRQKDLDVSLDKISTLEHNNNSKLTNEIKCTMLAEEVDQTCCEPCKNKIFEQFTSYTVDCSSQGQSLSNEKIAHSQQCSSILTIDATNSISNILTQYVDIATSVENERILLLGDSSPRHTWYDTSGQSCQISNNEGSPTESVTIDLKTNVIRNDPEVLTDTPYMGYTIDCTCNRALGNCVCTKSLFKPNYEINNIMQKNAVPSQRYVEKTSYIMNSKPNDEKDYGMALINMEEDLFIQGILNQKEKCADIKQDCATATEGLSQDMLMLKDSRNHLDIVDNETETREDDIITVSSICEASIDWCDCCSDQKNGGHAEFRSPPYYPPPLEIDDDPTKIKILRGPSKGTKSKLCTCETVPICQVKMLLENIENNLATSKCTCDSLISKVCPIHSK